MPWEFIQAMSFFTSAMTSGPMPSPGSSRSLWVAIIVSSRGTARIAKAQRGDWQAHGRRGQISAMTAAIILGIAASAFLGAGLVLTQFGLRTIHPLSGAAISVPSFTFVFLLLSPILLRGEAIVWHAVPIFVAVGL